MTGAAQSVFIISVGGETGLLTEILSAEGFRLSYADPGDDIEALIQHSSPDLVLVDVEGSAGQGIDICRSLKKAEGVGLIPVVLTAPLPDLQDKEDAFRAGCSDFITKPFAPAEVIVRIRNGLMIRNNMKLLEEVLDAQTEQLKQSETRFRDIFTRLSIGAVIFQAVEGGSDFMLVDFNPAAEQMEKISKEEVIGRRVAEVFPGIADFGLLSSLKRVWRTGIPENHPTGFYRDERIQGWRANHVFKLFTGEVITVYRDVTEEKVAEREVAKSRDFLQGVIDGVRDGLRVINSDGSVAYENRAALDAFSHAPAVPFDDSPMLEDVFNKGQALIAEQAVRDAGGRKRIFERSFSPVPDESGTIVQVIELSRDVTARKQWQTLKEAQMRLTGLTLEYPSKQLLQVFLDEIEDQMDSPMAFFHFFRKGQPMVGHAVWSAGTVKHIRRIQGDAGNAFVEFAAGWAWECACQKQPVVYNGTGVLPEGMGSGEGATGLIRLLVVPVVRNDRVEGTLGVGYRGHDYTETDVKIMQALGDMAWDSYSRKQAEEARHSSEERLSRMVLSSPDAICLMGFPDGCILDVNPSFEAMFGHTRGAALGMDCRELGLWESTGMVQRLFELPEKGRPVRDLEANARRASGEVFEVSVSADAMALEEDLCLVVTIRDISERKSAEKEKKALEAQLQQSRRLEAVGTMAGGIAHDFNNILSAIVGYAQLAMTGVRGDRETCDRLEQILAAGDRAKDLVSQILLFCRQETRELKPLRVQIIVKEAIKFLRSSLPSTIRIRQHISEETGMVMADPTQVHQVVMNICTNAYHAMKSGGGVLDLSLKQVELPPGDVSKPVLLKPGTYLELTISDTGAGIPERVRDRIFEPYYTTREKGEGSGLGLAVVHGIVTGLGGEVVVETETGRGTCFRVYLPVTHGSDRSPAERRGGEPAGGSEHLLFVDDEETLTEMHRKLLSYAGYRVTAATDGREALALFKKRPEAFDLVITDMTMPEMTGDVLAERIREIRPEIPIILVTGYNEQITPAQAEAKGIRGYFEKPFLQRELALKIRELLDKER